MKETLKNVDELYDKINQLLKSYDLLKKNNDKILEDLNSVKISLINKEDEIKRLTEQLTSTRILNFFKDNFNYKTKKVSYEEYIKEAYPS